MEALYDQGKARAIGVCNFSSKKLGDLLEIARVPPAVDQVECHPIWQQTKLRNSVTRRAWSPLGSPGTQWIAGTVLKHPMGHGILRKSTSKERIRENFDVFDWSIPDDLLTKFSEIKQERLVKGEFYVSQDGPFKSIEDLWDGEV
ncbi:OLC1v1034877C1 [Oldenlandia corymbosa var. corymbosa]|uniref:OLC1v1034877C1 n=1 Tax=Oldenlandia corymbosa var. corymbosa TaxID=529605 RepID=A0AAV1CRR0_OLDCO|nr:OLC1v1034877C1 [Oldenlandia corymbosa var. corymbosa]